MRRLASFLSVGAVLLAGAGCSAQSYHSNRGAIESSRPAATCATAETADDCGGWNTLVKEARKDKSLVIAGNPDAYPLLATAAKNFAQHYDITVRWVMPDLSTQERFERTAEATAAQPDVFSLDPNTPSVPLERLSRYRVDPFDMIPDERKEPSGAWIQDFAGVMAIGYNQSKLGKVESAADLLNKPGVSVGFPGDPARSSSASHALLMLNAIAGSRDASASSGLALLEKLHDSGHLASAYTDASAVTGGDIDAAIDWSFVQYGYASSLKQDKLVWRTLVPGGAEVTAYHASAVNAQAPHAAAARLWQEWIFTAPAQVGFTKSGAMPTLYHYLQSIGAISWSAAKSQPVLNAEPWEPQAADVVKVQAVAADRWKQLFPQP